MNAKRRDFQLTESITDFELEPMTFASGVKSHCSAFHGLTLNRPIKAFIIVEIKLAQPTFLYLVCRSGKRLALL